MGAGDDTGRPSELTGEPAGGLAALPAVHRLATIAARRAIDERRAALLAGASSASTTQDLADRVTELLAGLTQPSLRRVINATGVILHTNLGRAPLARAAQAALAQAAAGYVNLELDLADGTRGSRQAHVEQLLTELAGAPAALVVNNGAAAVLLAVTTMAGDNQRVAVSRGQLVEIGGGFRIPDVIAQSGAEMVEVGTTNRTRLSDYEHAQPDAILRVHRSNFATVGFTADVEIEELCTLGPPVIDDVGSGVLTATAAPVALAAEPSIRRSLTAGAALVCCSGDKLLGGPQAGLILGDLSWVGAAAAHPLARALRIDKLSLAALEATLMLYRDPEQARREIPVLAMLDAPEPVLAERARRLADGIGPEAEIVRATARAGGGSLPLLDLEGPAVAVAGDPVALAAGLRAGDPPVIARIHEDRLLLDPRTVSDDELDRLIAAARRVRGADGRKVRR